MADGVNVLAVGGIKTCPRCGDIVPADMEPCSAIIYCHYMRPAKSDALDMQVDFTTDNLVVKGREKNSEPIAY